MRAPALRWGLGLGVFGLVERAALWFVYAPASFGDSPSYMRLAGALSEGGLSAYDGTRVPGYPALLALLAQDPRSVWLVQMALGWGISMLLFWLGWKTTGSPYPGFSSGMLYNLIPGQVLFEANLLSETLSAFFVILSLALWVALQRDTRASRPFEGKPEASPSQARELLLAGLLGATSAVAGMVRPLFFLLSAWLFFFVLSEPARVATQRMARAIGFGIGPVLILGGWLNWVSSTYGMFAPTTMGGYHLVQHTGEYFEYLPDEVAPIRDTYLKYRDAQIAERGVQTNAIWDAIPEMSEVSGLSFFELSVELQRLSLRLIVEHPDLYFKNVIEGWIDFWKAPVYWDRGAVAAPWLGAAFAGWAWLGRVVSLAANGLFLVGSVAGVVSRWARSRLGIDRCSLVFGGLVWLSSIVQTLVDHGDNPRFLVPLQSVVILLVVRAAWTWKRTGAEA